MRKVNAIHFVGIGGAGMSGIAEVLHHQGFVVTGSDRQATAVTMRLQSLGITVFIGHAASHIDGVDAVVVSSAIDSANSEVSAALEKSIPIVPRAEMLSELMRFRYGIAIAGTHGKTTTTSMTSSLLAFGGLDPTFIVGGQVKCFSRNAQLGQGPYLVAEADESDGSFLYLQPIISVITNIDQDHLDNYEGDINKLEQAFIEFVHHVPFYGLVIVCVDDPVIKRLMAQFSRPVLSYGLEDGADIQAKNIQQSGDTTEFAVSLQGQTFSVKMSCAGKHNVQNALAAIAVAHELGMDNETMAKGLKAFKGIQRRFDVIGHYSCPYPLLHEDGLGSAGEAVDDILVIDDYAHHPREISAIISAVRSGWERRRLVVVFQPHRYSRTRDLFEDFVEVLSASDVLVLTNIYAAGEAEIAGIDARALCRSIRLRGKVDPVFMAQVDTLCGELPAILNTGDVLLFIGAGNIAQVSESIQREWLPCRD